MELLSGFDLKVAHCQVDKTSRRGARSDKRTSERARGEDNAG